MERTLVILKPDCMEKRLYGEVLGRLARASLEIVACKMVRLTTETLREHYAHVADLPFYPELENYMRSRPVIILVLKGANVIQRVRQLMGPTDSLAAPAGTIRGDMGIDKGQNVMHASDSPEAAEQEIARFFEATELCDL